MSWVSTLDKLQRSVFPGFQFVLNFFLAALINYFRINGKKWNQHKAMFFDIKIWQKKLSRIFISISSFKGSWAPLFEQSSLPTLCCDVQAPLPRFLIASWFCFPIFCVECFRVPADLSFDFTADDRDLCFGVQWYFRKQEHYLFPRSSVCESKKISPSNTSKKFRVRFFLLE